MAAEMIAATRDVADAELAEAWNGLFASAAVGLFVVDAAGRILHISKRLCEYSGLTAEQFIGTDGMHLLHPDERLSYRAAFIALTEGTKDSWTAERRILNKDGEFQWVLFSTAKMPGMRANGGPAFVTQVTSIGKQKRAEKAAADVLQRWTFALENAGQGMWDYDVENDVWEFSAAWKRMRAFDEDATVEFITSHGFGFIHPDDRDMATDLFAKQKSGEVDEIAYEYRYRRQDGNWIWIMVRGCCLERREDGTPLHIMGTDTDITELKKSQETYHELSERLQLALDTSRIGIWETDPATLETIWDERTCEIFGCSPADFEHSSLAWPSMLHPDDREHAMAIAGAGVTTRSNYNCQYRIIRPDGEIRHLRSYATFSQLAGGGWKMLGANWDITTDVERAEALDRAKILAEQRNVEIETARAAMEHASLHDALTGLANRRYLDRLLDSLSNERGCDNVTILHVDLDRFKQINDTRGHAAGDALLVHMAGMLSAIVGPRNTVARIGGDEFVVILSPSPGPERLHGMINEIIQRSNVPIYWRGQECRTSTSIGVAIADGRTSARQLLINADLALYRAKNLGRNQATHFDARMHSEIVAQKQCGDDIIKGLAQGDFFAFYQPQFCSRTLDIIGVEALARWRHPVEGILTPDRFLSVAQDLNAMHEIDRAILEKVLKDLKRWDEAGIAVPEVSVNVSANRLADEGLIDTLARNDWARNRISIELLESIFLDDSDPVYDKHIGKLRELGVDIAIDDFGTGHASIIGLLKLSPYRLKIDRRLIAPIADSPSQRGLIKSIIDIGKSQGIQVCAEGVETRQHLEILRELECECLQGFYFGQPMAAGDLPRYVAREDWRRDS
ncbi:bifunctional diguanylate cyclase/phosphodiesterase [Pseudohoeflea suaedae]|uniref:Bifunctional diguanylate cyclase/phosphodiesterase n=1 Tax=Pseudohoeflea suaedae TaxID=877384 RepID=A0A4R5PQI5_9HYPH|nr:bifunctional diguanylate cyclase/phosphodiesterase [Pseudohoeflea suaedae]TDH38897.1 bifunctional diguanylate cyclase/phosphodiesterase [Pseudohoeflea suaedae]